MNILLELEDLNTPPQRLRELYASGLKEQHLALLAKHPSTPLEVLLQVGEHYPEELLQNPIFQLLLLETPNAALVWPEKTVRALLSCARAPLMMLEVALHHKSILVKRAVASSVRATERMRYLLSRDAHAMVVIGVAENTQTSAELLALIATHMGIYVRLAVAKNPNTSVETLHSLATDVDWQVRHMVALHPRTQAKSLSLLAADAQAQSRAAVAAHPQAPQPLIALLAQLEADHEHPLSEAQEEQLIAAGQYGGLLLTRRAKTSSARLMAVISKWPRLGREVSAHPEAHPEALRLISSQHKQCRQQVAAHPNTPRDVLAVLLTDQEPEIRQAALQHPSAPTEVIALLHRAGADALLQQRQAPQTLTPMEFQALFEGKEFARFLLVHHPEAPPEMLFALAKRGSLVDEIAVHPRATHEVLSEVSRSAPKEVAQHLNAGPLLETLATSPLRGVRHAVAKNPRTPAPLLAVLSADKCREVRYAAAQHPASSAALCEQLACDGDWLLRRAAVRHPSTPLAVLARLCQDSDLRVQRSALALYQKRLRQSS